MNSCEGSHPGSFPIGSLAFRSCACAVALAFDRWAGVRQEGKRMAVGLAFGRKIGVRWVGWREVGAGVVRLLSGRVLAL